ncbi:PD40 domain-containing protein [Phototrophicus methaneseepsis]|uniref:PD40 domain-containing protein n=1 Tax=Phototrophicus methaneseepsis TaxID=2710758 RepID=A0A7S8E819_9CHLR|nr:PD40 domain-containing protein [Phototrophicus methaneseepsis]QPC82061.1 PD40 domain-containing protein [Phototrophicus methaneseepsis]
MNRFKLTITLYIAIYCIFTSTVSIAQLEPHHYIGDISYSPDGTRIALTDTLDRCGYGEENYLTMIVDSHTLSTISTFVGHSCLLTDVAWSSNEQYLVSGGYEGISIVWNTVTEQQVSIANDRMGPGTHSLSWNPTDTLYVAWAAGGNGYIFNPETGMEVDRLPVEVVKDYIESIDWGINNVIAYGNRQGLLRLWDYDTRQELAFPGAHNAPIRVVKWSPQATLFASADENGIVKIWDSSANIINTLQFGTRVSHLVWSPDGNQIIIVKEREGAEIWDITTGQKLVNVITDQIITAIDWSPDGNQIAYAVFPVLENLIEVVEVSTLFPTHPIADAGADITILANPSGTANVLLDASGSTDSDGTIVSYEWSESSKLLGTGISQTVTLPVGIHTIHLEVTDDSSQTDTDIIIVTVEEERASSPIDQP